MSDQVIVSADECYSATQIDTFSDCNRKWAWDKIEHVPKGENRFAAWGVIAHKMLEDYLGKGIPLDLTTEQGEGLMAGIHHFPRPGVPGMSVEGEFLLQAWGHFIYGKKDVQVSAGRLPYVLDLKTTTSFRYAHTPETLRTNVQAVIYGSQAMVRSKSSSAALRWVYVKSRKPWDSRPVDLIMTRADALPTLARIKNLTDQMTEIKRLGKRALDLAPNPDTCEKYGGCPYVQCCNLSPIERMNAIMTQAQNDPAHNAFLADIEKMVGQGGGAGTAINPPPMGAPPPPPVQGFQPPPGGQLSQDGKSYWAPGMTNWAPIPQAAPPAPPMNQAPPPPPPMGAPPPPPPPPPVQGFQPPPGGQLSQDGKSYWAPGMTNWAPIPDQNTAPMPPAAESGGKEKKGGRPAGSKNKPKTPETKGDAYRMIAAGFEALADLETPE
jgi:hypothetical protein